MREECVRASFLCSRTLADAKEQNQKWREPLVCRLTIPGQQPGADGPACERPSMMTSIIIKAVNITHCIHVYICMEAGNGTSDETIMKAHPENKSLHLLQFAGENVSHKR